jgi:hypothetical protein
MEIPQDIAGLYRHWEKHTRPSRPGAGTGPVQVDRELLRKIEVFCTERMKVWERRQQGLAAPWTRDPVIGKYRFCNIYRELDRQTIEYHRMLADLRGDFDLWLLNMFYARMVCRPDTIRKTGFLSFDRDNNREVYERLMSVARPRYGNAYVFPVSTIMRSEFPTREKFLCGYLPEVMKKIAGLVRGFSGTGVCDALEKILPAFGFRHHFLWTEVLIDTAYQYPELIDLFAPFPIGPGAKPTMQALNAAEPGEKLCSLLSGETLADFPCLLFRGKPVRLSAENWEGIGCEFRKYSNLSGGRGRKRIYQ